MSFENFLKIKKVKLFIVSVIIGVCVTATAQSYSQKVMADISDNVVRLHVVANSNGKFDQDLKLKVRDEIINYLEPVLKDVDDVKESRALIEKNISKIEEEAEKTIKKYGYNYNVTVNSGNFDFPTKEYENVKFPKGKYYALKVVIGKGEGENWWCVLYPQLCFDYTESGALSKENDTKLKNVLTYDEYTTITSKSNLNFKFKILEWFSS